MVREDPFLCLAQAMLSVSVFICAACASGVGMVEKKPRRVQTTVGYRVVDGQQEKRKNNSIRTERDVLSCAVLALAVLDMNARLCMVTPTSPAFLHGHHRVSDVQARVKRVARSYTWDHGTPPLASQVPPPDRAGRTASGPRERPSQVHWS